MRCSPVGYSSWCRRSSFSAFFQKSTCRTWHSWHNIGSNFRRSFCHRFCPCCYINFISSYHFFFHNFKIFFPRQSFCFHRGNYSRNHCHSIIFHTKKTKHFHSYITLWHCLRNTLFISQFTYPFDKKSNSSFHLQLDSRKF